MEPRLANNGASMPSSDEQQSISVRKMPLSDLPNGARNVIASPQGSSFPRENGLFSDSLKVSGMKRHASDHSGGPHTPTGNNGTSGPLVYVRRKLEETGKVHTYGDMDVATSLKAKKSNDIEKKEFSKQPDTIESRASCSHAFSSPVAASMATSTSGITVPTTGIPTNVFTPMQPSSSLIPSGTPVQTSSPSSNKVHWKERFIRLQIFLNSCDHSSQEEYIQMLRSLSSVGRSKHAVELEKRAIHLLLEEGKELHRMKLLNVLGKVSP